MSDEMLTVPEAARRLGVSRMTVYRMVHSGELQSIRRVHQVIKIPAAEVARLAQQSHPRPTWRLTFMCLGSQTYLDFRCEEDARSVAEQGQESGLFIDTEVTRV